MGWLSWCQDAQENTHWGAPAAHNRHHRGAIDTRMLQVGTNRQINSLITGRGVPSFSASGNKAIHGIPPFAASGNNGIHYHPTGTVLCLRPHPLRATALMIYLPSVTRYVQDVTLPSTRLWRNDESAITCKWVLWPFGNNRINNGEWYEKGRNFLVFCDVQIVCVEIHQRAQKLDSAKNQNIFFRQYLLLLRNMNCIARSYLNTS